MLLLLALAGCSAKWYVDKTYPIDTGATDDSGTPDSADADTDTDSDTDADTDTDTDTSVKDDVDGDGFTVDDGDCDDDDVDVYPGNTEVCDGKDNDCANGVDDGAGTTWYADTDGDEYGDEGTTLVACTQPDGYVAKAGDCDDGNGLVNPDGEDVCGDATDYDCDGSRGTDDLDGDLLAGCVDCDDGDASIGPERTFYLDTDRDGYGATGTDVLLCPADAVGYSDVAGDCDDANGLANPAATETCGTVFDDDCDGDTEDGTDPGLWHADADGDGYATPDDAVTSCTAPSGYILLDGGEDCDDGNPDVSPGATETCNDVDDDCDDSVDESGAAGESTWYVDADLDGYGDGVLSTMACDQPAGYVANADDCDDTEETVFIGGTEVCDTLDNDCDGSVDEDVSVATEWYADSDGDGYGDADSVAAACDMPSGYVANADDCLDSEATVHPGASELSYTIWDDDCDGNDFLGYGMGSATATSNNLVDVTDSTFAAGMSASWDVISDTLGYTAADVVVSAESYTSTLSMSEEAMAFFGTGGAASIDDECFVLLAVDGIASGDKACVVSLLDNQDVAAYGPTFYLGDAGNPATWYAMTSSADVGAGTDGRIVAMGRAYMASPDVLICGGDVADDEEIWLTHIGVVLCTY